MSSDKQATPRTRILEVIRARPGLTRTELTKDVRLAWGTVGHHIMVLKRRGQIDIVTVGRQLRVAPVGFHYHLGNNDGLLNPMARDIVVALLSELRMAGRCQIGRSIGATPRRVESQLAVLQDSGIIDASNSYHTVYRLTEKGLKLAQNLGRAHRRPPPPPYASTQCVNQ
jgi:DNA-binding transcriptional ArsR family regulator